MKKPETKLIDTVALSFKRKGPVDEVVVDLLVKAVEAASGCVVKQWQVDEGLS